MSIYDYHRRVLSPSIWQEDGNTLTSRARSQLDEQVRTRFPTATGVYLIGDLMGHYWDEESDLDVLVQVPDSDATKYRDDVQIASGHLLLPSDHRVYFWLISDRQSPEAVAKHFGPIFDTSTRQWYGERVLDINEMTRPEAILRRVNWKLYKAKKSLELWPESFPVAFAAFAELPEDKQIRLLEELRYKTGLLDKKISQGLTKNSDPSAWKKLEAFENALFQEEDEELPARAVVEGIPEHLVQSVLHKFRYLDLLEEFENRYRRTKEDREGAIMSTAKTATSSQMMSRLDSLLVSLVSSSGGYSNAPETIYEVITRLLDSKYINTTARQRNLVYKLYQRYYQGKNAAVAEAKDADGEVILSAVARLIDRHLDKEEDRKMVVSSVFHAYTERSGMNSTAVTALLISGSSKSIEDAVDALAQIGYSVNQVSAHSAVVENVLDRAVPDIQWAVETLGCSVEGEYGREEIEPAFPRKKKAFKLALQEGKWYFAERAEDVFPLVLVRSSEIAKTATDGVEEESQIFTLELLGPDDGIPYQVKISSPQIAKWGLRPATVEDFEELDIIPPEFGQLAKAARTAAPRQSAQRNFGRLKSK